MPLDIDLLRQRFPERQISYFESIESTMTEAAALSAKGCPSGTVVVAGEQKAGIGRHGHSWHSEKDVGLYLSVILRPDIIEAQLPPLTIALGLAAVDAISRVTDLECDLRWPNDVMIGNRKVAGILVQASVEACIAGIGINVNHESFPAEIENEATSLRRESAKPQSRENVLIQLLLSIDSFSRMLVEGGRKAILSQFMRRSSYGFGKPVTVNQAGAIVRGVTAGLTDDGFLIVDREDGKREIVMAGGVRATGARRGQYERNNRGF